MCHFFVHSCNLCPNLTESVCQRSYQHKLNKIITISSTWAQQGNIIGRWLGNTAEPINQCLHSYVATVLGGIVFLTPFLPLSLVLSSPVFRLSLPRVFFFYVFPLKFVSFLFFRPKLFPGFSLINFDFSFLSLCCSFLYLVFYISVFFLSYFLFTLRLFLPSFHFSL